MLYETKLQKMPQKTEKNYIINIKRTIADHWTKFNLGINPLN